jgi:hypothetical protein
MDSTMPKEKSDLEVTIATPNGSSREGSTKVGEVEVFSAGEDGVDFRTVGWIRGINFVFLHFYFGGFLSLSPKFTIYSRLDTRSFL